MSQPCDDLSDVPQLSLGRGASLPSHQILTPRWESEGQNSQVSFKAPNKASVTNQGHQKMGATLSARCWETSEGQSFRMDCKDKPYTVLSEISRQR